MIAYNYHLSPMQMLDDGDSFDEDDDYDDDDDDSVNGWMESDDDNDLFNLMINAMFDSDDDFYLNQAYEDYSDDDFNGFMWAKGKEHRNLETNLICNTFVFILSWFCYNYIHKILVYV